MNFFISSEDQKKEKKAKLKERSPLQLSGKQTPQWLMNTSVCKCLVATMPITEVRPMGCVYVLVTLSFLLGIQNKV